MNKIRIYRQDKKNFFQEIIESNNYERNKLRENLLEKKIRIEMTKNLTRNQSFIIKNQINNISEENKKNKKIMVIAK